jgi:hypothetical protein
VIKEANHDCWLPLPATQIAVQLVAKLARRAGTSPAGGIGLDVMVQQLHRVQLGL